MAGNFTHFELDDHGLIRDIELHVRTIDAKIFRFTRAVQDRMYDAAQRLAPSRGDFRRGDKGAPGNLKRATEKMPVVVVEGEADAIVRVNAEMAPYAKWVVGGSGPKKAHTSKGMAFPETRGGVSTKIWGPFRAVAGNPKQDFLGDALQEVRLSAWLKGREKRLLTSVGSIKSHPDI